MLVRAESWSMVAMADQTVASVLSGRRARPQNRRLKSIFGRDWTVAYPFVLPMVLLMIGLIAWPFLDAIRLSGTSLNYLTGETSWVGFRNYAKLLTSSDYHQAIGNTFTFTFWSLLIKFVTGMTIALILNSRLPYRNILSGIMLLPWIVPEIVTALTWKSIYDPLFGSLNPILLGAGIIDRPQGWLSDPNLAMPSIIAVNVWKGIPFFVLLFLAGLKAVDREQLEAAEIDGASVVQRFRHVTLPSMRYVIVVTLLLSFISTFNQFGLPFLMTGGGPSGATKLYSILAYEKAIGSLQYGPGAAIAISVAPLMAVLIWLLAKFMRQDDRQRPAQGGHGRPGRAADRPGLLAAARRRVLAVRDGAARPDLCLGEHLPSHWSGGRATGAETRGAAQGGHGAAAGHSAAVRGLRDVPVLLGAEHLAEDHAADLGTPVDLLAGSIHHRTVPVAGLRHAVRDLALELGDRGAGLDADLGRFRRARGLCAVAPEVPRGRPADHVPADHLPACRPR